MLAEPIEEMVAAMTMDEKRSLAQALMRMVAAELAGGRGAGPDECPLCHCGEFVRKGHDKDGSQRWLCKGYGRTFGRKTMRVIAQSKLGEETWTAYADGMAEGMAEGLSLRELAARCGVCLKTSWFMRMRICEAMAAHLDGFQSGPGVAVEVDGTMLHESFAGNGSRGSFEMPREVHESGKSLHARGVSGQLACVVCAANDRGGAICELVGHAHSTAEAIHAALEVR